MSDPTVRRLRDDYDQQLADIKDEGAADRLAKQIIHETGPLSNHELNRIETYLLEALILHSAAVNPHNTKARPSSLRDLARLVTDMDVDRTLSESTSDEARRLWSRFVQDTGEQVHDTVLQHLRVRLEMLAA